MPDHRDDPSMLVGLLVSLGVEYRAAAAGSLPQQIGAGDDQTASRLALGRAQTSSRKFTSSRFKREGLTRHS